MVQILTNGSKDKQDDEDSSNKELNSRDMANITMNNDYNRGNKPSPHSSLCAYVSCGEEFSCAVMRDHAVYAWGLGRSY